MKSKKIGIIAEDESDIKTIKILIERIKNRKFPVSSKIGHGCGKLMRKCGEWADMLYADDCKVLIVVHDSDGNSAKSIHNAIHTKIKSCSIDKVLICIPIQEIEAWLLGDPSAIKKAFKLSTISVIRKNPESIDSPKETLEKIVRMSSKNSRQYIHTDHNHKIALLINIDEVKRKCSSFNKFFEFIESNL
jgi:hypothetical protein